jgi:hypothetical protein
MASPSTSGVLSRARSQSLLPLRLRLTSPVIKLMRTTRAVTSYSSPSSASSAARAIIVVLKSVSKRKRIVEETARPELHIERRVERMATLLFLFNCFFVRQTRADDVGELQECALAKR